MHKYTDKVKVQSSWSQHKHACVHKYKNILCHSLHMLSIYMYMHHPCMTLHTTKCGDQCLIHYRTYQRFISYKVTKLTVPLKWLLLPMCESQLPACLHDEPHNPKRFAFPKRSFGKTKPVFFAKRRASD